VNHELRKKESFISTSVEVLTARGIGFKHQKVKEDSEKSNTGNR